MVRETFTKFLLKCKYSPNQPVLSTVKILRLTNKLIFTYCKIIHKITLLHILFPSLFRGGEDDKDFEVRW